MQHWVQKFQNAARGIKIGSYGQSSFSAHIGISVVVVAVALWLRCEAWQWCVLLLCMALVLSLELINSAIELLAKGLCKQHNDHVGKALDTASGAVLCASIFAAIIGVVVLGGRLWAWILS
jgi:diacylglycerol kinase